jgi:hypothetical protein
MGVNDKCALFYCPHTEAIVKTRGYFSITENTFFSDFMKRKK